MPKTYSEKERAAIIAALRAAAAESLVQNGVRRTTVDDLVRKAHIPKGTFYLFYDSKELLLYDALEQYEQAMHVEILAQLKTLPPDFSVDALAEMLCGFFHSALESGMLRLLLSGELEQLTRKLPDDLVAQHIHDDDDFTLLFLQLMPQLTREQGEQYSAALRAIFFTAVYQREIGPQYDAALYLLVRGLVLQMKEAQHD